MASWTLHHDISGVAIVTYSWLSKFIPFQTYAFILLWSYPHYEITPLALTNWPDGQHMDKTLSMWSENAELEALCRGFQETV